MSCHIKKNISLLIGTDYPELPININEMEDLSSFEMDILDAYEQPILQLTEGDGISVSSDGIVVLLSRLEAKPEGDCYYNLYTRYKGKKILAVYGLIKLTTKPFCQQFSSEVYTITSEDIAIHLQLSIGYTEISQSIRFESLTPEQIESLRGAPGKDFKYSDFTPEQIENLKQPAIDAAQVANDAANNANVKADLASTATTNATNAANNADAKATLANDAANNANVKADLASTATTNANNAANNANAKATLANDAAANANAKATLAATATTNANNAADNANDKATLANNAATNANNKASLAQNAADTANNAKGWTPIFTLEQVSIKIALKLSGYIGGTGIAPTINIGKYLGNGSYVDTIGEALNLIGSLSISVNTEAEALALSTANPNNHYYVKKAT